jgi:hypothetical protein
VHEGVCEGRGVDKEGKAADKSNKMEMPSYCYHPSRGLRRFTAGAYRSNISCSLYTICGTHKTNTKTHVHTSQLIIRRRSTVYHNGTRIVQRYVELVVHYSTVSGMHIRIKNMHVYTQQVRR